MNKRSSSKSAIVALTIPAFFLAIWAFSLRGKKPALPVTTYDKSASDKFKLVVNEFKINKLAIERGHQLIEFTIYVGHEGVEPKWWKEDANRHINAQWLQNMRLINHTGKEFKFDAEGTGIDLYDESRRSHTLQCIGRIPKGYDIAKPGIFKGTVAFANALSLSKIVGIARFSVPMPAL